MAIKGLPIIKCVKCGKTTVKDEYEITGCPACGDKSHGMDFGTYRRREYLADIGEGFHNFNGRFRKVGNLHYANRKWYALIENVSSDGNFISNHIYVYKVDEESRHALKTIAPGSNISFRARIRPYNNTSNKWGMDMMCNVAPTL